MKSKIMEQYLKHIFQEDEQYQQYNGDNMLLSQENIKMKDEIFSNLSVDKKLIFDKILSNTLYLTNIARAFSYKEGFIFKNEVQSETTSVVSRTEQIKKTAGKDGYDDNQQLIIKHNAILFISIHYFKSAFDRAVLLYDDTAVNKLKEYYPYYFKYLSEHSLDNNIDIDFIHEQIVLSDIKVMQIHNIQDLCICMVGIDKFDYNELIIDLRNIKTYKVKYFKEDSIYLIYDNLEIWKYFIKKYSKEMIDRKIENLSDLEEIMYKSNRISQTL